MIKVSKEQMTYSEVITYNDDLRDQLHEESKNDPRSKGVKSYDRPRNIPNIYFLKNSKDKKTEFYNKNNSLFVEPNYYDRDSERLGLNFHRFLMRNDYLNKKYLVFPLDIQIDEETLVKEFSHILNYRINDRIDDEYSYRERNTIVELFEQDCPLPSSFRSINRSQIFDYKNGFYDVCDDKTYFIIPRTDLVYNQKFPLVKFVDHYLNILKNENDDSYDNYTYGEIYLQFDDVELPIDLIYNLNDHNEHWRMVNQELEDYQNNTSKINLSLVEMFDKGYSHIQSESPSIEVKSLSYEGGNYHNELKSEHYDQHQLYYNGHSGFGDDRVYIGEDEGVNKLEQLDQTELSDQEKVDIINTDLTDLNKQSVKDIKKFNKQYREKYETLLTDLKKQFNRVQEEVKEKVKTLSETTDFSTNDFVEQNRLSQLFNNSLNIDCDETIYNGLFGRYSFNNDRGLFNKFDIETLRLFKNKDTKFDTIFKGYGVQLFDTSKPKWEGRNKTKVSKHKVEMFIEDYSKKYFSNLSTSKGRTIDLIKNGTSTLHIYVFENIINDLKSELNDLNDQILSNNRMDQSKRQRLSDILVKDIEIVENYTKDQNYFKSQDLFDFGQIENLNENDNLINNYSQIIDQTFIINNIPKEIRITNLNQRGGNNE